MLPFVRHLPSSMTTQNNLEHPHEHSLRFVAVINGEVVRQRPFAILFRDNADYRVQTELKNGSQGVIFPLSE
jgi:hypothetical protein